jgi:hypothetical protein
MAEKSEMDKEILLTLDEVREKISIEGQYKTNADIARTWLKSIDDMMQRTSKTTNDIHSLISSTVYTYIIKYSGDDTIESTDNLKLISDMIQEYATLQITNIERTFDLYQKYDDKFKKL